MLYLVGALAGGNYVYMVIQMVSGVLLARIILPETLGAFSSIGLLLGYAPFLQLGILNGINRELPFYIGKGDHDRVRELAAAAQAWALVVGGVVAFGVICFAGWTLAWGDTMLAAGWATHAILVVLLFYNSYYLQMTYRTSHDFALLSLSRVIHSVAGLILLGAVYYLGFYGLCLRMLVIEAVSLTILYYWRPIRVSPKWNFGHLWHLLKIGAPIFAAGQLYAWWTVVNSTLVLHFMGNRGMGLYAMVMVAGSAMSNVPQAVGQVIYPRLAEQYGRSANLNALLKATYKPTLLTLLAMLPLVAIAWVLVEPVTHFLVPKYVDAVPAIKWNLLCVLPLALTPVNNLFPVIKRQGLYVSCIAFGMLSSGVVLLVLITDAPYLAALPQAMLIGRCLFVVACYACIYWVYSQQGNQPLAEAKTS